MVEVKTGKRTVFGALSVTCSILVLLTAAFMWSALFASRATAYADEGALQAGAAELQAQEGADGLEPQAVSYSPMYRIYNPRSGEHFYTASKPERNHLVSLGWHYEGIGWLAPSQGPDVYRLYNPNAGDHHYTASAAERDTLVRAGWSYEGVGWKDCEASDQARQPLYRQYNPNAVSGAHNFTLSKAENDAVVRAGWRAEGFGWYGHAVPSGYADDMSPWKPHISGDYWLDTELDFILLDHKTLWSCYKYVSGFSYISGNRFWGNPHYLPDSTTIPFAMEMIKRHGGNCYRFASLMYWLARGLGYRGAVVSGWVPSASGGRAPHGWVEIWQNGTFVVDPDLNHELPGYNWFMVSYGNAPITYGSW